MIYLCFCLLRDFTDDARAQHGILDKTSTEALDILSERPPETT